MAIKKNTAKAAADEVIATAATKAKATAPKATEGVKVTSAKDGKKVSEKVATEVEAVEEAHTPATYRKAEMVQYMTQFVRATGMAVPPKIAALCIDAYEEFIHTCLRDGDEVLTTVGKYQCAWSDERDGRNLQTGEAVKYPGKWKPKFKPSASLKRAVEGTDGIETSEEVVEQEEAEQAGE